MGIRKAKLLRPLTAALAALMIFSGVFFGGSKMTVDAAGESITLRFDGQGGKGSVYYELRLNGTAVEGQYSTVTFDGTNNPTQAVLSYDAGTANELYIRVSLANETDYMYGGTTKIGSNPFWGHFDYNEAKNGITVPINNGDTVSVQLDEFFTTIVWAYDEEEFGPDAFVEHGKIAITEIKDPDNNIVDISNVNHAAGGYAIVKRNSQVTFKFTPDYGYQIAYVEANGQTLSAVDASVGVFTYTMPNAQVHFRGIFQRQSDIVKNNATNVWASAISGGENAVEAENGGNAQVTLSDVTNPDYSQPKNVIGDTSAEEIEAVNISVANVVSKGTGNYWEVPQSDLAGDLTTTMRVTGVDTSDPHIAVVYNHNGTWTQITPTMNEDGSLNVASSKYSEYYFLRTNSVTNRIIRRTAQKTASGGGHTHQYEWVTLSEASEDSDGKMVYRCSICGEIEYSVPVTGYYVFNRNTMNRILNAGNGATVEVNTSLWISFHKMVMEALAKRPDVTLKVSFLDGGHKGNRYTLTIPAGTDTVSLLDENGYSGFLYLSGRLGAVPQK